MSNSKIHFSDPQICSHNFPHPAKFFCSKKVNPHKRSSGVKKDAKTNPADPLRGRNQVEVLRKINSQNLEDGNPRVSSSKFEPNFFLLFFDFFSVRGPPEPPPLSIEGELSSYLVPQLFGIIDRSHQMAGAALRGNSLSVTDLFKIRLLGLEERHNQLKKSIFGTDFRKWKFSASAASRIGSHSTIFSIVSVSQTNSQSALVLGLRRPTVDVPQTKKTTSTKRAIKGISSS